MRHLSVILCIVRWTTASADTGVPGPAAVLPGLPAETQPVPAATPPAVPPATALAPSRPPAPAVRAAPVLPKETATYHVSFGLLGQVAQATLTFTPEVVAAPGGAGARIIRAQGMGDGAVLGFGRTEKHIESEFDLATLAARSWTNTRASSGKLTVDGAVQNALGHVALLRKRTGDPDLAESFVRGAAILDPLSFLLRLRMALPTATTHFEVLDGRALWLAEVGAALPDPDDGSLLRVDGHLDPVYWNGTPDPKRTRQSFAMSFTRDAYHTPVRLIVPHGMGELRAELVRLERPHDEARALFALNPFCRGAGSVVCRGLLPLWARVPASR